MSEVISTGLIVIALGLVLDDLVFGRSVLVKQRKFAA